MSAPATCDDCREITARIQDATDPESRKGWQESLLVHRRYEHPDSLPVQPRQEPTT